VTIYAPEGTARAGKTFNPYLGVVGGISIIGTTGIVEPRSLEALKKSILVEMRVARSGGAEDLVVTPGNYGAAFIEKYPDLAARPCVKCANFIGDTIDYAVELGFRRLLLVGHIGKFVKLAGGIMNTHSRMADCRQEIMAAYAALCGASRATVARLMDSATTDDCLAILAEAGLKEAVMDRLIGRAQFHAARRAAGALEIGVVIYSNVGGLLRVSTEAEEIIEKIKNKK
jgi:cobalt-precorrin-5B (C1)-methyltransferase